ncbi:hypothetical protein KSS87_014872 [Heliosperma pusillum]|nr:hypothetical protein KSS87_014872 [Heliosperma pusillum]
MTKYIFRRFIMNRTAYMRIARSVPHGGTCPALVAHGHLNEVQKLCIRGGSSRGC